MENRVGNCKPLSLKNDPTFEQRTIKIIDCPIVYINAAFKWKKTKHRLAGPTSFIFQTAYIAHPIISDPLHTKKRMICKLKKQSSDFRADTEDIGYCSQATLH